MMEDAIKLYLQPTTGHGAKNALTNDTTWFTTAKDGLKLESMERPCLPCLSTLLLCTCQAFGILVTVWIADSSAADGDGVPLV